MPAVCHLDSGAPMSIVAAGYLKGLLEAKGVGPGSWPVYPASQALKISNESLLNCLSSTVLQVSFRGEAKPVKVQITGDNLAIPFTLGENAFRELGIGFPKAHSRSNNQKVVTHRSCTAAATGQSARF